MGALIAVINKKGESSVETAVAMLRRLRHKSTEAFGIASPTTTKMRKAVDLLQNKSLSSSIIIGHAFSRVLMMDKPQPIISDDVTFVFEGRIYPNATEISDREIVAQELQQNREEAVENLIKEVKGDFILVIAENSRLIVARDAMGMRPLYYGENTGLAALASERKALWAVGIEKPDSFPPGHIAIVDKNGFAFRPVKTLGYSEPKQIAMQAAAKELQTLLQQSINMRISGLKEVAVAFSGGLDSSVIAILAKKTRADVHLIHVSLEGQPETGQAKIAANELKLPLHVCLFEEDDVKSTLPEVLRLIEEPDLVKLSVGIPFYWTAKKAAEMGLKVMLAGQGADELFGGYRRYIDTYLLYGGEEARKKMFEDTSSLYETNLERDLKICDFHNVELRLPFATYKMAKFAIDLPIKVKIEPKHDCLRKLVLRQVAENLGLPKLTVKKPKKAIQYATGVNNALQRLVKKQGMSLKEYFKIFYEDATKVA
ncbi:MAG: asparagine synthetase B [Candidatus Bathyarchaeota archaeon]|nr:asparagine synthetase B [Candidatus Bathyarchaeota archaeon]